MAEGADKEKENGPTNQQEIGKNDQVGGGDPHHTNTTPLIISKLPPVNFTREKSSTPPPRLNSSNNNQDLVNENTIVVVDLSNGSCNSGTESSETKASAGNCSKCENGLDCQGEGGDSSRRHLKSSSLPHGVKLCPESVDASAASDKVQSEDDKMINGQDKWACLEEELRKAQRELKDKDAEVETSGSENFERMLRENFERIHEKLKDIRQQVEGELEDLTASLFEEAHKMVKEAKMKEVSSEKSLKEAKMQLDGLQAEVAALKTLLITSTPSRPNLGEGTSGGNGISIFKKQHKRYPSHNHLQYGRSDDEDTNGKEKAKHKCNEVIIDPERCEVDPTLHAMFVLWREEPTLSVNNNNNKSQFLQKIYTEDIEPCLSFPNKVLVKKLQKAIEENSIWVEPVPEKDKLSVHTECALVQCPRICNYRMRFAFDSDEWFGISRLCRDRIAAVCEFLNYLRYMKNGLVKASTDDAYWEIIRLRKQIALAKLGIPIS